jgi:ABC-2 type transport system permease protein
MSIRRASSVAGVHLRVSAMNELQYRANFFLQIVQSLLTLGTSLVVLAIVFSRTTDLAGWSRAELLVVMGVFTVVGGIVRGIVAPNMHRLMQDVRLGTFDHVLTKPVDAQVLVSIRSVAVWQFVDVVVGTGVIVAGLVRHGEHVGFGQAAAFAVLLLAGSWMVYCFWLLLTTGAFWFVRMEQIQELFDGVFQAGKYPVGIYPGWLRASLTFLVPLAFAITVPSEALTGRLTASNVALTVAVTVVLGVLTRFVWRRGLRRYDGASA